MFNPDLTDADMVTAILNPLLDDFQQWFERSQSMLESQPLEFLEGNQQADLLDRVKQARQEVAATRMLVGAMGGEAGIDMPILMTWHHLVTECWQVSMRTRTETR